MSIKCSTSDTAFVDYGVPSGTGLASRAYFRLVERGAGEFEPSPAFFDRLTRAFREAFVSHADVPVVPEPVEAAIEDARSATAHEFLDEPEADLREEVLPAFVGRVGRYTCAYFDWFPEGGAGVRFDDG